MLRNSTLQAKDREREEEEGEFIYPYDLGCWKNIREVFTLSGRPKSDGFKWNIVPECHQYTLTVSCIFFASADNRLKNMFDC